MADLSVDPFESFESEDAADASQLAVHGLLTVYFEMESGTRSSRADQIIEVVLGRRSRRLRFSPFPRSRWWIGLAAAVLLVLAFLQPWRRESAHVSLAFARALDNVLYASPLPDLGGVVDPTDAPVIAQVEAAMRDARAKMEETRDVPGEEGPFVHAWMNLYRNLRAIGRWQEALAEMDAALAFNRELDQRWREEGKGGFTYLYICLTDLGNTYALLSDLDQAFEYHAESFQIAARHVEWRFSALGDAEDKSPRRAADERATSLGPRRWLLAELAEATGDLTTARDQLDIAAEYFHDALLAECSVHGLEVEPADSRPPEQGNEPAGVDALWRGEAAPHQYAEGSSPSELAHLAATLGQLGDPELPSVIVHARGHLLREAQWLRLSKQPDFAWEALQLAQTIPYSPQHDESRLDVNEPMEALRLALARRDFAAALTYADQVEQRTGGLAFPKELGLTRAPISILAQTELRFLRAVAEAGRDPTNVETRARIEQGIVAGRAIANSLPQQLRDRYLARIARWKDLLEVIEEPRR